MKILFVTDISLPFLPEVEKRGHKVCVIGQNERVPKWFIPDEVHVMLTQKVRWLTRYYLRNYPLKYHFLSLPVPSLPKKIEKIFVPNRGAKNILLKHGIHLPIHYLPPGAKEPEERSLPLLDHCEGPIFVFRGSQGLDEFCQLPLPGTQIVITNAPLAKKWQSRILYYPDTPEIMSAILKEADVFIASSTEELFPISFIEAGQRGVPIASKPTLGAKEYIRNGQNGYISHDLATAALKCLSLPKEPCIEAAKPYTIEAFVDELLQDIL